MRLHNGFSLVELVVVVVIIGVLSSYGVTVFAKQIERDKLRKAVENLKVVYNMEKRFKLENGQYFPKKSGTCVAGTAALINTGLGVFIRDNDFSYSLTGTCTGTITTGYSLAAKRLSGKCLNNTITLGDAGGDPVVGACSMWQ